MSRLLEIRDYATAVHTFEWNASWRTRKVVAKIKSGTPDTPEVPDFDWWAVKDPNLGPAD